MVAPFKPEGHQMCIRCSFANDIGGEFFNNFNKVLNGPHAIKDVVRSARIITGKVMI